MRLTVRQGWFVDNFIIYGNAAEAARQSRYSRHSARWIGWENLQKTYIRKAIIERIEEIRTGAKASKNLVKPYI